MVNDGDGSKDRTSDPMFLKGQSKRIWGELYKVIDSSDVLILVRTVSQSAILFFLSACLSVFLFVSVLLSVSASLCLCDSVSVSVSVHRITILLKGLGIRQRSQLWRTQALLMEM